MEIRWHGNARTKTIQTHFEYQMLIKFSSPKDSVDVSRDVTSSSTITLPPRMTTKRAVVDVVVLFTLVDTDFEHETYSTMHPIHGPRQTWTHTQTD